MGHVLLLMPADPLRPRLVDSFWEPEAQAARDAGHQVVLVDHDGLAAPGGAAAAVAVVPAGPVTPPSGIPRSRKSMSESSYQTPQGQGQGQGQSQSQSQSQGQGWQVEGAQREAVYRGWMLRSERYADFAAALAARGVRLRTSAQQYRTAHELPGWYPALTGLTPPSAWTVGADRADFDRCRRQLGSGPVVLRDYTKSMKHYWAEAALIPEIAVGDAAWRVASRFLELRGDDFVGGFVLRRFEDFDSAEARTWWVDGRCVLIGPHPDASAKSAPDNPDLSAVTPVIARLGLPFVTVDVAHRFDGAWRVVEIGDGQVSDRPAGIEPAALIAALANHKVTSSIV